MRFRGSTDRAVPPGKACHRRVGAVFLLGSCLVGNAMRAEPEDAGGPCAGAEVAARSATEALDRGEWTRAGELLRPLKAAGSTCPAVALGLARLRAKDGDTAEAERLFEQATTLAPDDPVAHAQFARYWLSRGQPARADYEVSRALALDPGCPEGLVVEAEILNLKDRPREAFETLGTAARLGPENAEAQYQLGVWLFRANRHAEAVGQFEKAAALRPADARTLDYLALGYEALGEGERADETFERALQVNDRGPSFDPFLDYNYGRFLLKVKRLDESAAYLDRAAALLPHSRGVHYERGKLNLARGDYERAREEAEHALSLRDESGTVLDLQVYYLLATVCARLGETELAKKYADLARTTPIPNQD